MNLSKIIDQLPRLKKADLKKLKNKIDFLLINNTEKDEQDPNLSLLYKAANKEFNKKGLKIPPFHLIKKELKKANKELDYFLEEVLNSNKIKIDRRKVYKLFLDLTIKYLKKCDVPISLKSILNNANKFTSLIDNSFPEYTENNLISLLFS